MINIPNTFVQLLSFRNVFYVLCAFITLLRKSDLPFWQQYSSAKTILLHTTLGEALSTGDEIGMYQRQGHVTSHSNKAFHKHL